MAADFITLICASAKATVERKKGKYHKDSRFLHGGGANEIF